MAKKKYVYRSVIDTNTRLVRKIKCKKITGCPSKVTKLIFNVEEIISKLMVIGGKDNKYVCRSKIIHIIFF